MGMDFEIGFVMAGAISAGAYSAGVMDFITEAIDAYEAVREMEGWSGPTHRVRVPVIAGASAGGMTAAITSLCWFTDLSHVGPGEPPGPEANRLYASWVREIDVAPLLDPGGLNRGVLSVLNCAILERIVDDTLTAQRRTRRRTWLGRGDSQDVALIMTASNLRGVPYAFQLFGQDKSEFYGMLNHGDAMRFMVGSRPRPVPGFVGLDTDDLPLRIPPDASDRWFALKQAALATGAFPIGLQARQLQRDFSDYTAVPSVTYQDGTGQTCTVPPHVATPPVPFGFVAVDGGVIDNEPFEIARRYLAGGLASNRRDASRATRAMILVDPFPNHAALPDGPAPGDLRLLSVIPAFLRTLIDQARFKPEELALAQNDRVFSRFAVVPSRPVAGDPTPKHPIACGILGGFGGFLHESFRRHDYLLGRRNAQAFLRWSFMLAESNPLFEEFRARRGAAAQAWYVKEPPDSRGSIAPGADAQARNAVVASTVDGLGTEPAFPIIPLTPRMLTPIEIPAPDLPDPDAVDLDRIGDRLQARLSAVAGALLRHDLPEVIDLGYAGWLSSYPAQHYLATVGTKLGMKSIREGLSELREAFPRA
ncbi:patatin-like phospholipase family protein [Methylobacterium sp. CB376]|uniref:patatin-like phospholipase family protein n=1 Tax=unclassified Methylobacterium TaxID=2615210 RepID=UPI0002F110FC|nr:MULTISPECIES: patatin-like phospholipase family protein [Methylobacterium]WFT81156.1 patatin-like phospholipase family protein [Methylobacterium nodulans]